VVPEKSFQIQPFQREQNPSKASVALQLLLILPQAKKNINEFYSFYIEFCEKYEIYVKIL